MLVNFLIGRTCGYILGKRGLCYVYGLTYIFGLMAIIEEYRLCYKFSEQIPAGEPYYTRELVFGTWIKLQNVEVLWSLLFDSLSVVMAILVFIITLLVHIYSAEYMSNDPSFIKFMSYISLFSFFMLLLVTSGNFVVLFLG